MLLFPVAGISACSIIRALSCRVALSATPSCPPSLTPPLAASGQGPQLPQGLDSHLPPPGPGWPSLWSTMKVCLRWFPGKAAVRGHWATEVMCVCVYMHTCAGTRECVEG